jgi:hypothetical protein
VTLLLAAMASALALAHAPSGTPVTCYPDVLPGDRWGSTDWDKRPIDISLFGPQGCAAALYASETPKQRVQTIRLNLGVNFAQVVGQGLLLDLHEASHVGLMTKDECIVEQRAYALLPTLLRKYFLRPFIAQAMTYATAYHTFVLGFYNC